MMCRLADGGDGDGDGHARTSLEQAASPTWEMTREKRWPCAAQDLGTPNRTLSLHERACDPLF
jgi:hypothetical protein